MKVLITGGYGFIGSHVADRFYKEGHEITIIDNMCTGDRNNVKIKHNSYIVDVEDKKCEEIYQSHSFDVVIHLAAQIDVKTSMDEPFLDTRYNILGLINMLQLAAKYKVKRFIFASSAAVYGNNANLPLHEDDKCDPVSLYGINKSQGEMYCQKWLELYGLNTVCFRFSNIYGPRQSVKGEGGVVARMFYRLLQKEKLIIYGDGSQTRDFLYVEDVADAIYRTTRTDINGVYNLSSNSQTSINELVDIIGSFHPLTEVIHGEVRTGDILHSRLDNTQVKKVLDWVPRYTIAEGLEKSYKWYSSLQQIGEEAASLDRPLSRRLFSSQFMPYIENLFLFVLVILFSYLSSGHVIGAAALLMYYIVFIGITNGSMQAIVAVIMSSGFYIFTQLSQGKDMIALLYDPVSLLQLSLFVVVGLVVGYATDRKERGIAEKEEELNILEERYQFLSDIQNKTRMVKEELQAQIANSEDSFGRIYKLTSQLDSLNPENVFYSAVEVVETVMKTDSVCLYTVDASGYYLRLMATSNKADFNVPKSIRVESYPYIQNIIARKEIFANKNFDPEVPMMIGPVIDVDRVVAMVIIHEMEFENLTLYHMNLFSTVTKLISSSIGRAYRHEELLADRKYIAGTPLLKKEYFVNMLNMKKDAKDKIGLEYVVLGTKVANTNLVDFAFALESNLRKNDSAGMVDDDTVYIILSGVDSASIDVVQGRLQKAGIDTFVVSEYN